jgi:hypothetical protein
MNAARVRRLSGCLVLLLLCVAATPSSAAAEPSGTGSFLAGAAIGLVMHEAGHLVLDLSLGASPGLRGVRFGPIPFFAITHDPVSPAREFAISSAGFWMQHVSSEIILTRHPRLRSERGPLLKGIIAFNVLASVAYASAAFAQTGPDERDTRGMAVSASVGEPWVGGMVLAPAVLDAMRYYHPEITWVRWASRAAKAAGVLIILKAN